MITDKFPTIGEMSPDVTLCLTSTLNQGQVVTALNTHLPHHDPRNYQSQPPRKTMSNLKSTWLTTTDPVCSQHVSTSHYPWWKAHPWSWWLTQWLNLEHTTPQYPYQLTGEKKVKADRNKNIHLGVIEVVPRTHRYLLPIRVGQSGFIHLQHDQNMLPFRELVKPSTPF